MKTFNYKEENGYGKTPCYDLQGKNEETSTGGCMVGSMACQFRCKHLYLIRVVKKQVECMKDED